MDVGGGGGTKGLLMGQSNQDVEEAYVLGSWKKSKGRVLVFGSSEVESRWSRSSAAKNRSKDTAVGGGKPERREMVGGDVVCW